MSFCKLKALPVMLLLTTVGAAQAALVTPNNTGGDVFTNAGGANQGQAIGSTGWYYNNVRNGATVGINGANPRSGNGSVAMSGDGTNDKADIEYLSGGVSLGGNFVATSSMGLFSSLSGMSFDWYRNGSSGAASNLHPAMRVLLDADGDLNTTGDRGGLVFEHVYNGGGAVPVDAWTNYNFGVSAFLWNFGLGMANASNINSTPYAHDATMAQWQAYFPNAVILGFSVGIGTGGTWTSFDGAVDNISWTINGLTTTTNFELTAGSSVPEPASLLTAGMALLALAGMRRRRQA